VIVLGVLLVLVAYVGIVWRYELAYWVLIRLAHIRRRRVRRNWAYVRAVNRACQSYGLPWSGGAA
jgi:hypothetical protein